MGEIVNKKVQNISRYLERYPDDRNAILQAIEVICSCTSSDEIALDSISTYLFEKIPLVYSNPASVQIYAELLDKSLNDMFEQKDKLLGEFAGTLLVQEVYGSDLIRCAEVKKSNCLGMAIETRVMSDGIADIYCETPDFYSLYFGDTASWVAIGTYVDQELYGTEIYSRGVLKKIPDNYNCYAVDNILPFEVSKIKRK